MQIELFIFAIILLCYGVYTTIAIIGIGKLQQSSSNRSLKNLTPSQTFISIVASCRNEEKNIEEFIQQIAKQNLSKDRYELILVDDFSEDQTFAIATRALTDSGINYQLIKSEQQNGKKQNLASAITLAKGDIIVTTDADVCYRFSTWLQNIADYFNVYHPALLIMPIDFMNNGNLLAKFQIVENIALTAITAGYSGINKAYMCNGANLAFSKTAYDKVKGYESHLSISSGEDVFLLEDIKREFPHSIHYGLNRELIVKTSAHINFKDFFNQRVRWAYKAKYNTNWINIFSGMIILASNLLFPALLISLFKQSILSPYLAIFIMIKLLFDFLLLFLASIFLGRTKFLFWLIPFELVYWIYALLIGISSVFWKPYWKGKKVN